MTGCPEYRFPCAHRLESLESEDPGPDPAFEAMALQALFGEDEKGDGGMEEGKDGKDGKDGGEDGERKDGKDGKDGGEDRGKDGKDGGEDGERKDGKDGKDRGEDGDGDGRAEPDVVAIRNCLAIALL